MTDPTTINTGTYTTSTTNYCSHRLPCGYCMMLSRPCPMQSNTTVTPSWDPNWYRIYCNATGDAPTVTYDNKTQEFKNG